MVVLVTGGAPEAAADVEESAAGSPEHPAQWPARHQRLELLRLLLSPLLSSLSLHLPLN